MLVHSLDMDSTIYKQIRGHVYKCIRHNIEFAVQGEFPEGETAAHYANCPVCMTGDVRALRAELLKTKEQRDALLAAIEVKSTVTMEARWDVPQES